MLFSFIIYVPFININISFNLLIYGKIYFFKKRKKRHVNIKESLPHTLIVI